MRDLLVLSEVSGLVFGFVLYGLCAAEQEWQEWQEWLVLWGTKPALSSLWLLNVIYAHRLGEWFRGITSHLQVSFG